MPSWIAASTVAGVGDSIVLFVSLVIVVAWIWFNIAVMLAVLRTARATERSDQTLDLIYRELKRYRPSTR